LRRSCVQISEDLFLKKNIQSRGDDDDDDPLLRANGDEVMDTGHGNGGVNRSRKKLNVKKCDKKKNRKVT